ncbi:hypothetical protein KUTeg_014602 [Tegillarca granosa]|uniref:Uncharacterized protein n=1 Tax=Tegillarca granosa TaxID=220873 RepID=A0ABQ9ERH3_TEGGR|nr:hypothetical protein KUTeg_014602 [Tegillarca granosa]
MCLKCKKKFSNRTFYKHKKTSIVESEPIKTRSLKTFEVHKDAEFVVNILNKFRDGEVGSFIRGSKIIQVIGYKHFLARKAVSSKINEVKREVMMEMRELSRLFICFQSVSDVSVTFEGIYQREHLTMLEEALNKLCMSEDGENMKSAKILRIKVEEADEGLRSLVVARLTLYNARRVEEGSRLLEDWHYAENGTWTPLDSIEETEDEGERYLLGQFKLAYLTGKGTKSVPLLIPTDVGSNWSINF